MHDKLDLQRIGIAIAALTAIRDDCRHAQHSTVQARVVERANNALTALGARDYTYGTASYAHDNAVYGKE